MSQEKKLFKKLRQEWEDSELKEIEDLVHETKCFLMGTTQERRERFSAWWLDFISENPIHIDYFDDVFAGMLHRWERNKYEELRRMLKSFRHTCLIATMKIQPSVTYRRYYALEGYMTTHLAKI